MSDAEFTAIVIAIVLVITLSIVISDLKRSYSWLRLFLFGKTVRAVVTHVSIEGGGGGKRVQRIVAEWTQSGTNKRFDYSGYISGRHLYRSGDVVRVLIDPKNPMNYKVKPRLLSIHFHIR